LIKDDIVYFGGAVIDGAQLIDAFDCGEDRIFTVYADYDGSPTEAYG